MPESSVKITLGVELDKSDLEQQIKEFQEELKQYKLQVGIDTVSSDSSNLSTEEVGSSDASSPSSPPTAKINFDDVTNVVSGGVDSIKSMIDPLVGQIGDLVDFIKQAVSGIREDLQPIKDLAEIQKEGNKDLTKVTQDAIADIKNEVVGAVKEGVKEISDSTTNIIKDAADQISGDIREQLEKLINNQSPSVENNGQERQSLIGAQKETSSEITQLPSTPNGKNSGEQPSSVNLDELIQLVQELFADIRDASQAIKGTAGEMSSAISSVVGIVEDALNPLKSLTSSAKDLLQELSDIAKSSLSDLKDLLVQTLSESLQVISGDVKSLLDQYLKEILNQIQTGFIDFLQSIISKKSKGDKNDSDVETVDAEIVVETDDISNQIQEIINILESQKQKPLPSADTSNVRSAISSAASSTISLLDSLYQLVSDRLTEIASRLLPSILNELQFDFLKSLIGGAVENLGATISQQFSSGSANVLNKLLTGSLFKTLTPAKDATLAFGEGFQSADPTNQGQIVQKLDLLINKIVGEDANFGSKFKAVSEQVNQGISGSGDIQASDLPEDAWGDELNSLIDAINKNTKTIREVGDRLLNLNETFKKFNSSQDVNSKNSRDDIIDVEFRDVTSDILDGVDIDLSKLLPPSDDNTSGDSSDSILQDILKANQDLVIINREGIQERRTNIDQISGRSALDDVKRGSELTGKERPRLANAQLENILSKTANILREIPGNLQELANGLLKGAELAGVNTDKIVNVLDIIGGLSNLVDIIYKVNPELASSLSTLVGALGQDAVDILINGVNVATQKLPELMKNFDSVQFEDKTINLAQQGLNKILPNNQVDIKQVIGGINDGLDSLKQRGKDRVESTKDTIRDVGGRLGDRFPITKQVFDNLTNTADKLTNQLNKLSEVLQEYLSQTRTSEAVGNLGNVVKEQVNNLISPDELQRAVVEPQGLRPNESQTPNFPNISQLELDQFLPPELQTGFAKKQPASLTGQIFPDIKLPDLQDVLPDFKTDPEPQSRQESRQSIVGSMFNFIKNNLPQIVAGLIVAKLAAGLTSKITSAATGGKVNPDFTGLQSLLTKGIGVAGGAAIAKVLLPKITQFFQKDKPSDSSVGGQEKSPIVTPPPSERFALPFGLDSIVENKQSKSPIITPPPAERLALPSALQELSLPILGQLLLPAGKDSVSKPSFPLTERLPEIPQDLLREVQPAEESVAKLGENLLNILQNKLPQIVAGLLLAKLVTAIVGKLGGARPDNTKGLVAGGVQSLLTKGLLASGGVAIAKFAVPKLTQMFAGNSIKNKLNTPAPQGVEELLRSPVKPDVGVDQADLPKTIAVLVAGLLVKDLLTGFTKGLFTGQERQKSLIEKGFGFLASRLTGGIENQKNLLSKEGKGLKSTIANNAAQVFSGKDQNKGLLGGLSGVLLQKLPTIIAGAIVGLLIAKFAPLILSAVKPVNLSKTNEAVNKSVNTKDVAKELNNSQIQSVDTDKLQSVFDSVFDDIVRSSGLDPNKIDKNRLRPVVKVDEENRLKGASSYRGSNNQILLSNRVAQGLVSQEIPREVFVELAHEIRHAVQAGFGTNLQGRAEQISSGKLQVAKGIELPLLKLQNLIDSDKTGQVKAQVDASTNAVETALPNQKGFVQALELDAEVFAQNFADLIYGIKPDEIDFDNLFRINEDLVATLNQGLEGIQDSLDNQKKKGQTAVDLVQSQRETPVKAVVKETSVPTSKTIPQLTAPLSSLIQTNEEVEQKPAAKSSETVDKSTEKLNIKSILTEIQSQIQDLISIAKAIAQELVASAEKEISVDAQNLIPDSLLRSAPPAVDDRQGQKDQRVFGEKVGDALGSGIDNLVDRIVDRAQQAGASDGDIQEIGNQAGAFSFSMLSSFAPGGAIGLLVAPIAASLSSLGIPIAAAVNQLTPLAQMLIDTMQTLTPIQTRFSTIGGGQEQGQQMFDFAANTANDLNVPMLSAIEGYSRLAAASQGTRLEGKDTEELFLGISKAIAALGLSAQDSSLIFLAFQQILSKGVVTAEELRGQISERLPGALQIFADALGLTLPELSKALENGELNLTKLAKLGPAFQKEFAEGAEKSSRSFIGALNKIENTIFQLRISFVEQFGGIVGGIANVIAGALGLITSFIDNVVLKSGLLFNAILGIQAYALAGTFTLFKAFAIEKNLLGIIKPAYARLFPILLPFFIGTFVELISTAFGQAFGVQIDSAVTLITGFFSNVIGRVIQEVIDLSRSPQDALEGVINIIRNLVIGLLDIKEASLELSTEFFSNFGFVGKAIDGVIQKIGTLSTALTKAVTINKKMVNTLADNAIARVLTPSQPAQERAPQEPRQGIFNFKEIAQTGFELFGLYIILVQTLQLVKIIGTQVGITGGAISGFFKALVGIGPKLVTFGKGLFTAGVGLSTLKGILMVFTAGLTGSALVLGVLISLFALIVAKSDIVNSFLSDTSNSIKELQKLNKSVDGITGKKVELTVETTYTEEGMRDTPFQDKGVNLTFWRSKEQEKFTTDDIIRQAQKLIDDRSYRRNLPLIPNTPTTQNDNLANTGNIAGLQSVLTSEVARTSALNNVEQVVDLRQELIKEKKRVEDELVIELGLNTRNLDEEINKLRKDVESIESLKLNPLVARFSIDGGNSFEKVNRDRLRQLESQIAELEKQKEINQGALIVEGTSVDIDTKAMEEELKLINKQLAKINTEDSVTPFIPSIPSSNPANLQTTRNPFIDQQRINALSENQDNNFTELTKRREEILADLAVIRQTSGLTREEVQSQIAELRRQRDNLATQSVQGGGDRNIKSGGLNADINAIDRQIEILVKFEGQKEINDTREELDRINRDLKAFELFADNPAVFNNAFLQDDSLIKQMAVQQVELFPSINNNTINTQRLLENNAVTEIPLIREDITLQQSRNNRAIADLNTAIQDIDRSAPNAAESLSNLQKQLNSLQARNKSLTSLDLLLSTTESYARLGLGKAAIDANLLADALQSLAKELEGAKVQTTESAGFIVKPSLDGMLNLEQELLMQFGQQGRSLRQVQSERANIEATPQLSITEQDLGRFGYLSKEARADLEKLNKAIEETKKNLFELQNLKIDTMDDGIKATVSFEEWNTLTTQIESLSEQLQNLRKERDKILQDAAKLAPPIQVDPTFRQDRLSKIDNQIAEIQSRVNDLSEQYQAIQSAKLEIGGATAIARQLDSAIRGSRLTQDQKFLGILPNFAYSRRLDALTGVRDRLEPALGTVNAFAGQQTQLDSISLQGLLGGLQSGDISTTQKTLEQFDIQGNRAFFNGQELEGTPEEVRSFIEAIRAASKALKDIQTVANSNRSGTRIQKALESNLGLAGGTEERNRLLGDYRDTATRLFMSGAFDQTQFDFLTAPGRNLAEVEKALGDISRQGGKTNFSAIVDTLAKQGVPEEERTRIIEDLTRIQELVEGLKGTDPARSLLPSFGTVGEKEYNETVARIGEIDKLAFDTFNKLSLASFTGDLKKFEQDLVTINPALLDNLAQLRQIQDRLDVIGKERLRIQDQLARNDLTIEQRNKLEKESARLDEEFRSGYRSKKDVGGQIGTSFDAAKSAQEELDKLIENIRGSDLEEGLKQQMISQITNSQDKYLTPILEFFGEVEDLVALSADDRMALAFKNISRSLKNLQDSSARIQDETNKVLAASSLKFREMSTSLTTTPLTGLGVSGAGTSQDATVFDARVELETALTDERSRKQIRDIAFQEFTRSQEEFEIARASAANSPVVQQEELAPKREELTQITEQYAEAEQAYAQALTASSQARIALLEAETSAITRRNQLSTLLEQILLKEKRLRGEVNDETFDTELATQEFESIGVELAAAEALFKAITSDIEKGLVPSVVEANRKLEELNIRIAELKNQKLDKQLELENAIRAKSNQLIDNQINLTSKYLDVSIAGYERLNAIGGNTIKQLDGLTSLGQAVQSLFSATGQRLQTSLGQQANLLGQVLQQRGVLKSEDATPEERRKAQEREGDLRKLGQLQGVNISPNSSEAQVLAKQAEIEAKLAQAKIEALKKEQAIANALLKIELQRNKIAAEQAVKEAEINKLKQQQALFQAQANVQKAAVEAARTGDQTGLIMAQLDLQIAQSQLSTATEGVDLAKQNVLIQDTIAGLQLQQAGIDNANAKDNLIGELASNENLDLGKLLNDISSLLDFTPNNRTSREVFRPFLPKPKQETFIPEITVSLEEFNGDVNAWLNANIEANKKRREQAQQQNPETRAIEQSVFDVFGRPRQSDSGYRSGNPLGSLEEQFAALSDQTLGSRWGKLLAPTADVNIPTTEDMQQGNATFEEVAAFSLETTNKTLENIYGIVDTIPDTFVQATEQLGQMLINDEFKPIEIINKSSGFGIADGIGVSALKDLSESAGLFSPTSANLDSFNPTGFIGAKATPFGQTTFDSSQYPQQNSFKGFSQMSVAQPFGASDIPYYANQPFTVDNSTTSLIKPNLTSIASSFIPPVTPVSTSTPVSPDKPKDTEFVKYISPTVVPATVRPARVVTPRGSTKSSSDMFKLPSIPEPSVSLNNVVNPNIQVPRQEKTPFYFYRDIASEMSPQVDYNVPPGVQSLGQKHNYQPETKVQNISVNITNQIDANTQKDFFSKIARVQQEAIISAINNA